MTKAGIYIHIPFCNIKCMYCDYYSITKREEVMPHFVDMLIREIELTSLDYHEDWAFDTIFFGGGTPSLIEPKLLEKILNTLNISLDISQVQEITLEANPGEAPMKKLAEFRELGINRLSIGFQSLQNDLLTFLSRIHSPKDCLTTYLNARDAGFENINVDLIFNIPGQSLGTWKSDLNQVIKLAPDHISAYSLTVEPNTKLFTKVNNNQITMPHEETDLAMFELCRKYLNAHGYNQYEISNYVLDEKECLHNLHYWNLDPYLAFGPSSHGYDGHTRWWNISSMDTYIQQLEQGKRPVSGLEILTQSDQFNEAVFNGLRTREGIQLHKIDSSGSNLEKINFVLKKWKDNLVVTKDSIYLKANYFKYADEIASDMMLI